MTKKNYKDKDMMRRHDMTNKDKDIQRTQLQIHMKLKCEIVVISDS